jgi:hypothetical protein
MNNAPSTVSLNGVGAALMTLGIYAVVLARV